MGRYFVFSSLLGLASLSLLAQASEWSDTELDSIWKEVYIDKELVITGEALPVSQKNAIYSVRSLDAEEIRNSGYNNLAELMTQQLNMNVSQDAILGSGIAMQGIGGENVAVLIDGIPVVGRLNGNIDLSQIRLDNVLRIEMVQGAMSAQYGSNASGGVINVITKKSQLSRYEVHSSHHIESRGIHDHSVSVGLQQKNWYASIGASRYQIGVASIDSLRAVEKYTLSNGQSVTRKVLPWNPKTQNNVYGQLRYMPSDSFSVRLRTNYFQEELIRYDQVRGSVFFPYSLDEYYTTQRKDISLDLDWHISPSMYLSSVTSFNGFERTREVQRIDFTPDTTSLIGFLGNQERFNNVLHRSILTTTAKCRWNGQFGTEFLHESAEGRRLESENPSQYTLAAWASIRYEPVQDLSIVANLRYGYNSAYDHPWLPSVHALWHINRSQRLRMSYARGFRAPSLKELYFNFIDANHFIVGNPDLVAESSTNVQARWEQDLSLGRHTTLEYSVGLFYNQIQDRIFLTPVDLETLEYSYRNVENFSTHGLQVQVHADVSDDLSWNIGSSWTRIYNSLGDEILEDRYDDRLEVTNQLEYEIPKILSTLTLRHRYVGASERITVSETADVEIADLPDYQLMDLSLTKPVWNNRMTIQLGVKNIFDLTRLDAQQGSNPGVHSGSGGLLLGLGRSYFARLQFNLSGN